MPEAGLMPAHGQGSHSPHGSLPTLFPAGTVPGLGLSERGVGERGVGGVHGGPWGLCWNIGPFPPGGEGTESHPPDAAVPTAWHRFAVTVTRGFFLSNVCICVSSFIVHTMSSHVPENLAAMCRTVDSKVWEPVGTHSLGAHSQ